MTPGRLDRVTVQLSGKRTHVLKWEEREALLDRLYAVAGGGRIAKLFREVGASRPVELDDLERLALYGAISAWGVAHAAGRNVQPVPYGVLQLRQALAIDLDRHVHVAR